MFDFLLLLARIGSNSNFGKLELLFSERGFLPGAEPRKKTHYCVKRRFASFFKMRIAAALGGFVKYFTLEPPGFFCLMLRTLRISCQLIAVSYQLTISALLLFSTISLFAGEKSSTGKNLSTVELEKSQIKLFQQIKTYYKDFYFSLRL